MCRILLSLLPFVAIFLVIIAIMLTNHLATSGAEIRDIDAAIEHVEHQNDLLRQEVASASSLRSISQRASQMGFVEALDASKFVIIRSHELPVALSYPQ